MICKYRVTLQGIKGFFRVYNIDAEHSLYRFHKQLRSDLEFPLDQPILFKAFDAEGNVAAKYALIDLGDGSVDNITVAQTIKAGITSFQYFYDVKSKKSVIITFEGQEQGDVTSPTIIETKGPNPIEFENGYVAFEDLPDEKRHLPGERKTGLEALLGDDDDEDEDDEDEDEDDDEENEDEEEEIVYDDSEQ